MRRPTAPSAPARNCSSAAPIRPSRTSTGNAVPPTAMPTAARRSVQANASPTRSTLQQARRVRRGGGAGAAAASAPPYCTLFPHERRAPPSASSRTPCMHSHGAACRGRVLRRTPTHPRHELRVALRAIGRCCHRTAEGLARTYRIAAHSDGGRSPRGAHGHVARDALRVWLRVRCGARLR